MSISGTVMNLPGITSKYGFLVSKIALKLPTTQRNRRKEHLLGGRGVRTTAVKVINGEWCDALTVLRETTAAETEKMGGA